MALFDQAMVDLFLLQFLPFIIIFAILYALLQKSKVFGSGRSAKGLNAVISIAISAMVVFVNPLGINWATSFANLFSGATVIAVFLGFIVIFALMFSAARQDIKEGRPHTGSLTLLVAVVLAFFALSISGIGPQLLPQVQGQIIDPKYSGYIVLGIFAVIIIYLLRKFTEGEKRERH